MHKSLIFSLLLIVLLSCERASINDNPQSAGVDTLGTKVLFIGNSYTTFNDLPNIFYNLSISSEHKVFLGKAVLEGTTLGFHSTNPFTLHMINKYKWDFVVLQDGSGYVAYLDSIDIIDPGYPKYSTYNSVDSIMKLIRTNFDSTITLFFMPWAYEDGLTWIPGQTDTYFDMQDRIYVNTLKWSKQLGFSIAPIGWAWKEIMKTNPPLHYLYLSDFNHPSQQGSYLSACVIYSAIFKEKLSGNKFYSFLDSSEALKFQEVSNRIVIDSISLWNLKK